MKYHLLIASIALSPLYALGAGKHVHGEAELFIALQDNKVLLELETPAANILGFEHKPSNKKEHQKLKNSLELLATHTSLVALKKGSCKQVSSDIESPYEIQNDDKHEHDDEHHSEHKHHDSHDDEHHAEHKHHDSHDDDHHEEHKHHDSHDDDHHAEHKHHDSHDDEHHSESEHSDFHVQYALNCSDIDSIKGIEVTAFESFQGFENIQVNWVAGDKQGSQKATAKKTSVTLR